ncbi:MAG: response regulator transcription factor [Weeksellaceae bacterium]
MKKKILILEDEPIIANGLKMFLDLNDYECDVAHNAQDAENLIENQRYTAALCDINLKAKKTGIDFVKEHLDEFTPVVFLTAYADLKTMKEAELVSPFAYVVKPFDKNHLLITLNLAIANCRKKFIHQLPEDVEIEHIELSPREIDIIRLLSQSKSTQEIASELFISTQTVSTHRKNIFKKTKAKGILELISLAVEKGWI